MKQIPLTQGQFTIVDDEDYDELIKLNWCANWSPRVKSFYTVCGKLTDYGRSMHRIIMSAPKGMVVDHINHDTLDNRKCNLRVCTNSQNLMNSRKRSNNTSGYKGVFWDKDIHKWRAQITVGKKQKYLGSFISKSDAALAYNEASLEFHGEFGYKNIIKQIKENK